MKTGFVFIALLICTEAFSQTWVQKASLPRTGILSPFSFSIGGKLYVGGGWDGSSCQNGFYEYDPSSNSWTAKPVYPLPLNLLMVLC
jgi:N-acetylneuraminic acid mutarotase